MWRSSGAVDAGIGSCRQRESGSGGGPALTASNGGLVRSSLMRRLLLVVLLVLTAACGSIPNFGKPGVDTVSFDRAAFALALEANNQLILSVTARDVARECKTGGDAVLCKEIKQARSSWISVYSSARAELLKPRDPGRPLDISSVISALGDLAALGVRVAPFLAP